MTTNPLCTHCIEVIDTTGWPGQLRAWLEWYPLRLAVVVDLAVLALWCLVVGLVRVDMNSAWVALGVVIVPTTFVALCCSRTAARRWALERGAKFSPNLETMLHHHLTRTRVARTLGFTGAMAISMMIVGVNNANPGRIPDFVETWSPLLSGYWLPGLGYVIGSLMAESTKPRVVLDGDGGAAVLLRRRLGDYLDSTVREMFIASFVAIVLALTVATLAPRSNGQLGSVDAWGRVALPLLVAVIAIVGANWVCRRRERAGDEAALGYEELTRSATANALIGAAVAMIAEASVRLVAFRTVEGAVPGWYQVGFWLFALLALGFWAACGTKLVFRNRRIGKLRAAAGVA